ncbi:MAG: DUF4080 domain-containing protein [Lentisphaerae bacterium]|nr:DUF4080 domain-containing protein [Lentisphaerota bacterium]
MRLVWLSVNSSYSHSSLALPILHLAAQHMQNWCWECLEATVAEHPGELAVRLLELQPDLVCTTLYLFNIETVLSILERFKTLEPSCPVVVGGPECLGDGAEAVLRRSFALDCAVSGEGENCLPKILQAIEEKRFPELLPGTACRLENQEIRSFGIIPPLHYADWADAPAPVSSPFFKVDKPFVHMETTRGCPQGCLYCTSCRTNVRSKSLEQVRKELQLLSEKGVREIRLLDRTFNLPAGRAAALLKLFRLEFPHLRFHLEIHPQYLTDELRSELQQALPGQLHLEAGIQSLNNEVLQEIGRHGSAEQALQGLVFLCSCTAFETHADLLAGLPEQTYASMLGDVKTLINTGPAEIQLEILKVLPGTPLHKQATSLGILFNPNPPYEVLQTPHFSAQELLEAAMLSRMLDLFYNQPLLQKTFRLLCHNCPDFLHAFPDFLRRHGFSSKWSGSLKTRFQLLAEFIAEESHECAASLAFHWMKAGFPVAETPFHQPEQTSVLPEKAVLLEGKADAHCHKNTRLWTLNTPAKSFIFAFNRAISMQTPCAIWEIEKKVVF